MKNVSKTYKFIYIRDVSRFATVDKMQRLDYTFGNRMPDTHRNKWDVYNLFHRFDDRTMRKHFTDKPTRKINTKDFLPKSVPATEAAITLAFVKYFTYQLNQCRRKLTYLNKEIKLVDKYPNGFNPMNYNVYNPDYYRVMIKHTKENLAIWKAKYQELKDSGVYTYLELVK